MRLTLGAWQIASGVNFRYNYFLKAGYESSFDVIWRPGPQFSISVPSAVNGDRKVIIRDSWMSVSAQSQESYLWGSWIDDAHLLPNSVTSGQSEGNIWFFSSSFTLFSSFAKYFRTQKLPVVWQMNSLSPLVLWKSQDHF